MIFEVGWTNLKSSAIVDFHWPIHIQQKFHISCLYRIFEAHLKLLHISFDNLKIDLVWFRIRRSGRWTAFNGSWDPKGIAQFVRKFHTTDTPNRCHHGNDRRHGHTDYRSIGTNHSVQELPVGQPVALVQPDIELSVQTATVSLFRFHWYNENRSAQPGHAQSSQWEECLVGKYRLC